MLTFNLLSVKVESLQRLWDTCLSFDAYLLSKSCSRKRKGAINAKQLSYLEHYRPKSRLKQKNNRNGHQNCTILWTTARIFYLRWPCIEAPSWMLIVIYTAIFAPLSCILFCLAQTQWVEHSKMLIFSWSVIVLCLLSTSPHGPTYHLVGSSVLYDELMVRVSSLDGVNCGLLAWNQGAVIVSVLACSTIT